MLWFNLTPGAGGAEGQAVPAARRVPPGDLVRGRSRRHRQHGLPRRRRPDLRPGHAGQPHVVLRQRAEVSARSRAARRRSSPASASPIATATACSTTPRASRCGSRSSRRRGNIRERVATMIQEQLRQAGITVDVVGLDPPAMFGRFGKGDYESIYYGFQASAFDPAMNLDFWLSGGSAHVWNLGRAGAVGADDRRPDAAAGRGPDARRAAAALRRGAEGLRREPARDLFRRARRCRSR